MELWIRSQDKQELIKVDGSFHIQETSVNPHSHKWGILVNGRTYYAEYTTEKRALEVLDEIQKLFKPQIMTTKLGRQHTDRFGNIRTEPNEYEMKELSCVVYEMPKE